MMKNDVSNNSLLGQPALGTQNIPPDRVPNNVIHLSGTFKAHQKAKTKGIIIITYLTQSSSRFKVFLQPLERNMIMLKQRAVIATATAAQAHRRARVCWNAGELYLELRVGAPGMRVQMGIHGWYGNVAPSERRWEQGCSSVDESYRPETGAEDRLLSRQVAGSSGVWRVQSHRETEHKALSSQDLAARHKKRRTDGGMIS
jgi:hypothetical protein